MRLLHLILTSILFSWLISSNDVFAQEHISFSTSTVESGVVLVKDSLAGKSFLLLVDSKELLLMGSYDEAEKNMKLINFIRARYPKQPINKLVLLSNRTEEWNIVPLAKRLNSGIKVYAPAGFNSFRKTILSDPIRAKSLVFANQLDTSEYSFPVQEVKGSLVILFAGRKAELQTVRETWAKSAVVCFFPDTKTLVAFKYFENQLRLQRKQATNIYKWDKSLASWRFRCPSRVLGGEELKIFTTYDFEKYQKELSLILDSYSDAIADGLSAKDFVEGYSKNPGEIKLENEKNTLFFLHQQIKKYGKKSSLDN